MEDEKSFIEVQKAILNCYRQLIKDGYDDTPTGKWWKLYFWNLDNIKGRYLGEC